MDPDSYRLIALLNVLAFEEILTESLKEFLENARLIPP